MKQIDWLLIFFKLLITIAVSVLAYWSFSNQGDALVGIITIMFAPVFFTEFVWLIRYKQTTRLDKGEWIKYSFLLFILFYIIRVFLLLLFNQLSESTLCLIFYCMSVGLIVFLLWKLFYLSWKDFVVILIAVCISKYVDSFFDKGCGLGPYVFALYPTWYRYFPSWVLVSGLVTAYKMFTERLNGEPIESTP